MELAVTLLIAGFLIVFVVLILLIFIVTVYGKILQAVQKSINNRKEKNQSQQAQQTEPDSKIENEAAAVAEITENSGGELSGEIVAVIAAAVDAVYGEKPHRIKSVKRSRQTRSAWGNAGVIENTRPF